MDTKQYTSPEMEIRMFSEESVITASVVTRDPDKPIELPFVPAQ